MTKPNTVIVSEIIALFQLLLTAIFVFLSVYYVEHPPISLFWYGVYNGITNNNPNYSYYDAGRFIADLSFGAVINVLFLATIHYRNKILFVIVIVGFILSALVFYVEEGRLPLLLSLLFFLSLAKSFRAYVWSKT